MYLLANPALSVILKKLPKAPFVGCQYKTTLTDTANATLSTWDAVDIGIEHPNRVVIVASLNGVNALPTVLVGGVEKFHIQRITSVSITMHRIPTGTTCTITISAASSLRKAASIYVAYPYGLWRDGGGVTALTTSDAIVSDIKSIQNGFLIYCGGQIATLGTFTPTWNGTDAVTEDVDAQLEAASSYTMGHINFTEASHDLHDFTMASSASGTKDMVAITMGVPYGY